jgi:hypothetical protein
MLLLQVFHPGRNIERPDGRERQSAISHQAKNRLQARA